MRIDRFLPEVELVRGAGICHRRITIRGHDGSLHPFLVQNPATRSLRREERLMQLFRLLNGVLERRKESRMRSLAFHLPVIVPMAPSVRIVQDDPSYCTLYEMYEDHCDEVLMHKDDPLTFYQEKLKTNFKPAADKDVITQRTELLNLRMEINDEISKSMVPSDLLSKVIYYCCSNI